MRLNKFEKHVAEKMSEYPSALDTNALWDTLESDLEEKKRRRFIIILLGLGLLLAIGAFAVYQYSTAQEQAIFSKIESTEKNLTSANTSDLSSPKSNENIIPKSNTDSQLSTSELENNSNFIKPIIPDDDIINQEAVKEPTQGMPNPSIIDNQEKSILKEDYIAIAKSERQKLLDKLEIDQIGSLAFSKLDFSPRVISPHSLEVLSRVRPVKNWKLSLATNIGAFYTDRRINSKNDDGTLLKGLRESSEKSLEMLSIGIGVELRNQNNFFLTSGIHFNQITEQFDNQSIEFATEDIEIITEINYLSNGQREEVSGTFEQSQEIISTTRAYNTFRWAELSIGAGYLFTRNRVDLGLSGGLLWGAMVNTEGKIFDAENNIIKIEDQSPSIYRDNLGLGTFVKMELRYKLREKISLSAQLDYKYMPSSFTVDSYPLEINYQWLGIGIGLNYTIN